MSPDRYLIAIGRNPQEGSTSNTSSHQSNGDYKKNKVFELARGFRALRPETGLSPGPDRYREAFHRSARNTDHAQQPAFFVTLRVFVPSLLR